MLLLLQRPSSLDLLFLSSKKRERSIAMHSLSLEIVLALYFSHSAVGLPAPWGSWWPHHGHGKGSSSGINVQLGPRPYYLVNNMDEGALKDKLEECTEGPFSTSSFSISHRGAPLMFPEHSREGYIAAARMGAGSCPCLHHKRSR